jgi:hypothetical protein
MVGQTLYTVGEPGDATRCDHCGERLEVGDLATLIRQHHDDQVVCGLGCQAQRQLNAWRDALAAEHLATLDEMGLRFATLPQVGDP